MIQNKRLCVLTTLLVALSLLAFANVPQAVAQYMATDVLVYGGPEPQNEVSIAVNPLNPNNIVVGFNDIISPTTPFRAIPSYAYSTDGGATWTYGGGLPRGTLTFEPFCDPWLAFDSSGYLYYVALSGDPPDYDDNHEVFVSVAAPDASGMVGPLGFGNPQIVDAGARPNDKPAIAVDTTGGLHDGNIYVVWARSPGTVGVNGFRIWFRRGTRTPGTTTITWDPAQQVGPSTFTQGPQVAVGPNGEVYVAYQRQTSVGLSSADAQLLSYSTDGGSTFTTNIFVSSITPVNFNVPPLRWDGRGWARHTSFPTLGASPTTGTIFIAWADRRNGDDDILLSRSTDGGNTWLATPKRVNTDALGNGKDQWHPALTVNSLGTLWIIFYDRRDDPINEATMLYAAKSTDEGVTFTNWHVSDIATNPDAFLYWASGSLGDYVGIDSVGSWTYVSWGDGRNGNPGPPPDYNSDVYFDKWVELYFIIDWGWLIERYRPISFIPPWRRPIRIPVRLFPINGFKDMVSLRAEGVPLFADYYFDNATGVPPFETALNIIVGEDFEEGTYEVKIIASSDNITRTQSIEVVLTTTPYILLETMIASPGDIVTLEGHGFTADSFFDVFFNGELLKTDQVDAEGMISTQIKVPADTPDGVYTVLVRDEEGIEASATLSTPIKMLEEKEGGTFRPPVGGVVVPTDNAVASVEPLPSWIFICSTVSTVATVALVVKKRKRQPR